MKYIITVCKIGQGEKCCRYLTVGSDGYRCQKLAPFMRNMIDTRIETSRAKGDNCEGIPDNIELLRQEPVKSLEINQNN